MWDYVFFKCSVTSLVCSLCLDRYCFLLFLLFGDVIYLLCLGLSKLPGFLGCLFIWCKHLFECWCDQRTFSLWCGYITNEVLLIFMLINWIQNVFNSYHKCRSQFHMYVSNLVIWIKDLTIFLSVGLCNFRSFPKTGFTMVIGRAAFVALYWISFCLCSWACAKLYHVCVSIGMQVLFMLSYEDHCCKGKCKSHGILHALCLTFLS